MQNLHCRCCLYVYFSLTPGGGGLNRGFRGPPYHTSRAPSSPSKMARLKNHRRLTGGVQGRRPRSLESCHHGMGELRAPKVPNRCHPPLQLPPPQTPLTSHGPQHHHCLKHSQRLSQLAPLGRAAVLCCLLEERWEHKLQVHTDPAGERSVATPPAPHVQVIWV